MSCPPTSWATPWARRQVEHLLETGRRRLAFAGSTDQRIAALVVGSALRAGVRVPGELAVIGHDDTPMAGLYVEALVSRTLFGRLTDALGARTVAIAGFVVTGLATVPFALAGPGTDQWWLLAVLLVRGIGTGAVLIPVMSVAYVDLAPSQVPHASIITRLLQQLGGAFGTAVLAVILEGAAAGAATVGDYAAAFDVAFWWATAFTLVAVVACAWLPGRVPQRRAAGVAAADAELRENRP